MLLTPKEVACELGVPERRVQDWLRSGLLAGVKLGARWRVRPEDLDRFRGDRAERARGAEEGKYG
ncbi:MAG TPA: helix-turn-helix domain-containing protein [Armatimonadota bacterium]|jgi:excisionase family DNA binding protein